MLKKLILIFILIIFSSLCLKFAFSAQKYTAEQTLAADCAEGLDKLEAKIDGGASLSRLTLVARSWPALPF